ncbi:MAG TPA: gamma-glutamylcyclotransferase family protein [Longimicrobiales bacterium]|nr:gamma-glutamylcyclotransferase family protein [Longimicrobiales bacterium]
MTINYFGYGSNMGTAAMRAKGVDPLSSRRAELPGWRLRFNVRHWFRHEGGMASVEPSEADDDRVLGVLHVCRDEDLARLDALEAYGVGYDRITVEVRTDDGPIDALTYVGLPRILDDACRPTRRYLDILLEGAREAELDPDYIRALESRPLHPAWDYPPFEHPPGDFPVFHAESLARYPDHVAVDTAVFDMSGARSELDVFRELFGGKDTTLFHLKRLESGTATQTLEDVHAGRISRYGRIYLNAYLHEYDREFTYAGRFSHA